MSKNTIRTKSVDEIMKGIKGEIYSKDNLQEWYNEIYENATKIALKYKSLKQLIPPQSTLKPLIDKSYKYTGDYYKNLNDKYISKDAQVYISKIKDETIKKAIVPIHKKGDSSKYSKRSEKSINLQTLHSFLKIIKNTFRMYSDKYSCPLSLIKEFIIECENYYSFINSLKKDRNKKEKYENKVTALKKQKSELNKEKKNLIKDDPEYENKKAEYANKIESIKAKLDEIYDSKKIDNIEIFSNTEYIKFTAEMYLYFFIMSAFDCEISEPTKSDLGLKNLLTITKAMIKDNEVNLNNANFIEILNDILKNWK